VRTRAGRPARQGRGSEDWGTEREENVVVLSKNTRRCVRRKERKTEQWEDESPYIHRSLSIPKFLLTTSLSSILYSSDGFFPSLDIISYKQINNIHKHA
jgi:hypothetical protein